MTTPRKQTAQTQTQLPAQRHQRQVSYCQQMQMQPQTPTLSRFPIDAGDDDVGVGGGGICATFANTKYNRCMHSAAPPPPPASSFSRSITALPTSDNFGSYTTLLMDSHQQHHHQHQHHHQQQQQPQSQHHLQQAHQQQQQQQQQHHHHHHQLQSSTASTRTPLCSRHCNFASNQRWYPPPASHPASTMNGCCYLYNAHATSNMPAGTTGPAAAAAAAPPPQFCVCDNWYQQRVPLTHAPHAYIGKSLTNGCYYGYEHASHLTDEEDSAFPALADREFHLLHRNIPALRRTGIDTTRIRQYFYPDGGWGWIICGVSFLIHILTTGLQLSYGLLLFYAVQHLHNTSGIELLGALSWSISMLATPFVVSLCRKRSIRLLAIVGGLVLPLGILFTSFATEFGQVVFSYGIVFGIGVAMVREASTVMLGNYFKRRRQFVEMVAMSGEGVGIALFSVVLKEGVGKAGWRLGLQLVAALTAISFFMGLMYRPASLYHPQRRAIQHLKNQRKKLREKKPIINPTEEQSVKYFFLDISSLKSVTVKILLMTSGVAAFGIYTPMFLMALNAAKEGSDVQELVLLQTFLGISMALGVVIAGALLRRTFTIRHFVINTKIISQIFIALVALAILFLSFIMGYKGLCILSWFYGIGLGGFQYSLKILALERVKLKHFSKAWGFIRGVESVPVLISVPLTSFLNDYSLKYGRAGYYICSAAAAISGIIIFFINEPHNNNNNNNNNNGNSSLTNAQHHQTPHHHHQHQHQGNGFMPLMRHASARHHRPQHIRSTAVAGLPIDYPYCDYTVAPDLLLNRSCISLNQVEFEHTAPYYNSRLPMPRRAGLYGGQQQPPLPPPPPTHFDGEPERAHYNIGQGSIGARMGKRLQKSLSFIQQQNCCDGQLYSCSCHGSYQLGGSGGGDGVGSGAGVGYKPNSRSTDTQPLICTCSPSSYAQSSRSRSVPEGLSNISQQCNCELRPPMLTAGTSREYIYVPQSGAISGGGGFSSLPRTPRHHQQGCARDFRQTQPQCRLKRSQSLCRPVHFVEQITTSV